MTPRPTTHGCVWTWLLAAWIVGLVSPLSVRAEEATPQPSFLEGAGKCVGGLLLELPKTVIETISISPPLIIVGVVAGTVRAAQVTWHGLREMSDAFDPWGIKKEHRARQAERIVPSSGVPKSP